MDPPSPCFLKVICGSLIFKGRLTCLNRDYTLFSPNGNPLRAKGSLSLTEAISSRETQAKKKNQKAEGKFVTFKQGDSLI
ncbi:CIS tube protein, partial [Salmonella enterica]|uniref:CIS tube protein n=1 Tax=Salmonella enterica TaxID=28901 RepID=UPI003F8D51C8